MHVQQVSGKEPVNMLTLTRCAPCVPNPCGWRTAASAREDFSKDLQMHVNLKGRRLAQPGSPGQHWKRNPAKQSRCNNLLVLVEYRTWVLDSLEKCRTWVLNSSKIADVPHHTGNEPAPRASDSAKVLPIGSFQCCCTSVKKR